MQELLREAIVLCRELASTRKRLVKYLMLTKKMEDPAMYPQLKPLVKFLINLVRTIAQQEL